MKKNIVFIALFFTLLSVTLRAEVTLHSASYQEKIKVLANGKKDKQWVKAEKVVPGTVIRYINTLENHDSKEASRLLIKNAVPKNMEYLAHTAGCAEGCKILFSVDGGKHFKKPSELFVGRGEKRHLAKASEYTHIEWVLKRLEKHAKTHVEYKARLK